MGTMTDVIDNNITSEINSLLISDTNILTDLERKVVAYMDAFFITYWEMIDEQMDWVVFLYEAAIGVTAFMAVRGFIDDIIEDTGATYDDIKTHIDTMLDDTETRLWDETHYYSSRIDVAIGDVLALLGFTYRESDATIISAAGDILHRMTVVETRLDDVSDPIDADTMAKLLWVADHYEEIKALAEGDIDTMVTLVLNEVSGKIDSIVATQLAPYVTRLETVEQLVATHQFFFFDWLMDVVAWMLTGMTIPMEDIEDALITVGEWFIDEIFEITNPLLRRIEKLEAGTSGEAGLTEEEVRSIVDEMLADIEGIAGPQGPPGPPGPMGPTGPAGPKGEVEIEITDYIDEIDRELYYRMDAALKTEEGVTYKDASDVLDGLVNVYFTLNGKVIDIEGFLTDDMKTSLTDLVEAFGTPEALISFILDVEEGEEDRMLELMQVLISMTFERGLV